MWHKKKVPLRKLQELVGHLNFTCRVMGLGQAFLHRLCKAMCGLHCPFHRKRVTVGIREHLEVWRQFLDQYNGISTHVVLRPINGVKEWL